MFLSSCLHLPSFPVPIACFPRPISIRHGVGGGQQSEGKKLCLRRPTDVESVREDTTKEDKEGLHVPEECDTHMEESSGHGEKRSRDVESPFFFSSQKRPRASGAPAVESMQDAHDDVSDEEVDINLNFIEQVRSRTDLFTKVSHSFRDLIEVV